MDYAGADRRHLWHPFTQQRTWTASEPLVVESAEGNWLVDTEGRRYLDGVASLWCNVHGHRHPHIDAAIRAQLDRVAHSTLLGLANTTAVAAATALVDVVPDGLTRVFFSENGAAAVEVALKMAFRYWHNRGDTNRRTFLALDEAYHGDTLGAVSAGGIDLFHAAFAPLLFECFRAPTNSPRRSLDELLDPMDATLAEHAHEICAVVIEPRCQGAAGMITFPAGYVRGVRDLCDRHGVLMICDEVATGFGRTGTMFACEAEGVTPDLMAVGKGITGGYLPMSATLTTEAVYESFLGEPEEGRQLFHGHTYSGNALAAAACIANLEVFREEDTLANAARAADRMAARLEEIAQLERVADVRRAGTMVGIELDDRAGNAGAVAVCARVRDLGVVLRPLGPVVVWMPPLSIESGEVELLADATATAIAELV
ncbi:MAG: adenosylmethionine--8-amino-7-oxononanoate transaminase [Acidimicrobiia bacterium]